MKLLIALAFYAVVMFFRDLGYYRAQFSLTYLLRKFDKNPAFVNEIAAGMQHIFGFAENSNALLLRDFLVNIEMGEKLGEFEVLRKIELADGSFLFVTMCHEKQKYTYKGKQRDYVKKHQLNFLIKNDLEQKRINVWSDDFESLPQKFLRQEFAPKLLKHTVLQ